MKLLTEYIDIKKKIHEYFGYVEDWKVIPLEDFTGYYWKLNLEKDGRGEVIFKETPFKELDGECYVNHIYTQHFLPKWVYRKEDFTMISVDTQTDDNKFLGIFDNKKEIV